MDDGELDRLLLRAVGPVAAPPSLYGRLATIPAAKARVHRWQALLGSDRLVVAAGIPALAAALLLGIWLGAAGHRSARSTDDLEAALTPLVFMDVASMAGDEASR